MDLFAPIVCVFSGATGSLIGSVGGLLGVLAFLWRVWDYHVGYLHIDLHIDAMDRNGLCARTTVENKSLRRKRIENAILLVGPESEDPGGTVECVLASAGCPRKIHSTNEIAEIKSESRLTGEEGRQIIPLPFFYWENLKIADERVSYRVPISTTGIPAGVPYSVRFFVVGEKRLHRSTHDMFILSD